MNKENLNELKDIFDSPSYKRKKHKMDFMIQLQEAISGKEKDQPVYYDPSVSVDNLFIFPKENVVIEVSDWQAFYQQCLDNAQCNKFELFRLFRFNQKKFKNLEVALNVFELQTSFVNSLRLNEKDLNAIEQLQYKKEYETLSTYLEHLVYEQNFEDGMTNDTLVDERELFLLNEIIQSLKNKNVLKNIVYDFKDTEISLKINLNTDELFKCLIKKKYRENQDVINLFQEKTNKQIYLYFGHRTLRNKGTISDPHKIHFILANGKHDDDEYKTKIIKSYEWERELQEKNIAIQSQENQDALFAKMFSSFIQNFCENPKYKHIENCLKNNIKENWMKIQDE